MSLSIVNLVRVILNFAGALVPGSMPTQASARIFISYSRKDGAGFAADLRKRLNRKNLSIWQDIVALEGGRDWWSQIEDALRSETLQHLVLVTTPAAVASPTVRSEIRLARQEGKTLCPVKGPGLGDPDKLPRWLGQIYDLDLPEHYTTLLRVLQDQSRQKRVPMMAPEPPIPLVERPEEFNALKQRLLDAKGDAVAISAALRGAGGYGKTTLAQALAHNPDIQEAYFDGVLWVTLGERPDDLRAIISDRVTLLTGQAPGFETVEAAGSALGEALGDRRILMIIDDVWSEQDLSPFLQGGPKTTRLITTRLNRVLPDDAFRQAVDAMKHHEARELLSSGLPVDQLEGQSEELGRLAGRLGKWPQLLKLVNGFLRERVIDGRDSLQDAILDANEGLNEEGLVAFDADDEVERTKAVARTINLSLNLLDEKQRPLFAALAVFPENVAIPVRIVTRLWRESGLTERRTKDLLIKLHNLSLLLSLDLGQYTLKLHDTTRHFLQNQAGKSGTIIFHKRIARILDGIIGLRIAELDEFERRYFYLYRLYHSSGAGDRRKIDELLLDPEWLKAKLAATASPQALLADYTQYGVSEFQLLIGRKLQLIAGICARDRRQLIPQLLCRLAAGRREAEATRFLDAARRCLLPPAILARGTSLASAGAETARLEGHAEAVSALCMLPDGRLASGSRDRAIRLWDVTTGAVTAYLEGHTERVYALCILPDGRLASCAGQSIWLWDTISGAVTTHLEGHTDRVGALCVLSDGRLASCSRDHTIRLWDVRTGTEAARLEGHTGSGEALCVLPDGRLASGSRDSAIRLWDVATGAETAHLEGHTRAVLALCVLPDGRLASGSLDRTIRLWDVTTGFESARLEGNTEPVFALCVLPDGRLASGSEERTIQLWDTMSGAETSRLEGHKASVDALCALSDGRLASGSGDKTIRLWDVTTGSETARLEGHAKAVGGLCVLSDGRLASGSLDRTIRLWDVATGTETARLEGHKDWVFALCGLRDGRLASGSRDGKILLWDVTSGAVTTRLEGHRDLVCALCVLPDGRLASGSRDRIIRLWDVTSGAVTARLECRYWVFAMCVLPDGRLASGSEDNAIRLWDLRTGTEPVRLECNDWRVFAMCILPDGRLASGSGTTIWLWDTISRTVTARLVGHTDAVSALCVLPDGRLASGSYDNTIRLWNIDQCCEITRLELDAPVTTLAALSSGVFVAGDHLGLLHWLEMVE